MKKDKGLKQSGLRVWPEMLARGSRWIFGLLWALPVFASMAFGSPVYAAPTISLTVPATSVELDFSMAEVRASAFKKSTAIQPVVTTDNPQGYSLYISSVDENTSLDNGTYDHINSISSALNETAFTAKTWGYSLDNTNFKPIPKASNPDKIAESQLPATASSLASVAFGVKVSPNLYEGTYQKEIVFTAVTNTVKTVSYMDNGWNTITRLQWLANANAGHDITIKRGNSIPYPGFCGAHEYENKCFGHADLGTTTDPFETLLWTDIDTHTIYFYSEKDIIYVNENAQGMFNNIMEHAGSGNLTIDLTGLDFSKAKNLKNLFAKDKIKSIEWGNFNIESAETVEGMFRDMKLTDPDNFSIDFTKFNTRNATDFSYMFSGSNLSSLNLSGIDTRNATNMSGMFSSMINLSTLDVAPLNTSNVTDMSKMFASMNILTNLQNLSSLDTSKVENMSSMFSDMGSITSLDLSHLNTSLVTDMSYMFSSSVAITDLDLTSFDTHAVGNMSGMFYGMSNLANLNMSGFDTSNVTDMSSMFFGLDGMTTIDLSPLNTSSVTDMTSMFQDSHNLTHLDLSGFDTTQVGNFMSMFEGNSSIATLDLTSFHTPQAMDMSNMFKDMSSLTNLIMPNFDTSNVTNMSYMFSGLTSMTSLNLSHFNTSLVDNMGSMFQNTPQLSNLNLSSFNTSQVTDMSSMFEDAMIDNSTLDLSSFDTSQVISIYNMFGNTRSRTIYASNTFVLDNIDEADELFNNNNNLVGGNGTAFSGSNPTNKTYARIDAPGTPGYFTQKP